MSTLPFHSVAFHLLSQTEIEEALSEAEKAEINPPPGMSPADVTYWVTRIRTAAGFIAISVGQDKTAQRLFKTAQCAWHDILLTFAKAGFIQNVEIGENFEPLAEDKYVRHGTNGGTFYRVGLKGRFFSRISRTKTIF